MSDLPSDLPKHCCARCHFLVQHPPKSGPVWLHGEPTVGKEIAADWWRWMLVAGAFEKFPDDELGEHDYCYGCNKRVWDSEEMGSAPNFAVAAAVKQNRKETCFFYAHTPGMSLPVAEELERRVADRREAKRYRDSADERGKADRALSLQVAKNGEKHTRWSLWISAGMLLIFAIVSIVGIVQSCRQTGGTAAPVVKPSAPKKSAPAPTTTPAQASPK